MPLTTQDLVRIRTTLGLTQERMAALLGVSFVSVNRWERGHSVPLRAVLDLYEALDGAVRAGNPPEKIIRVAAEERPQFLQKIFTMAYASGGRR